MERLALEDTLSAHPEVQTYRIDRTPQGAISGLHVVVRTAQAANETTGLVEEAVGKQFARSKLKITVLEHPTEGVSQNAAVLEKSSNGNGNRNGRLELLQVSSSLRKETASIEIMLSASGSEARARQAGPLFPGAALRLAAEAALEAVAQLNTDLTELKLEDVSTSSLAGDLVVLVALSAHTIKYGRLRLHGSAGVGDGAPEASAARAVLDALNRATV